MLDSATILIKAEFCSPFRLAEDIKCFNQGMEEMAKSGPISIS